MMADETYYKSEEKQKMMKNTSLPAIIIIVFGVLLLAANLFQVHLIDWLWPGFIIIPGLLLLWPAFNSTVEHRSKLSFLAVPGAMVLCVGLLLFIMNLVDHFEAWAYSWPLLIAAGAAGLGFIRRFDNNVAEQAGPHKIIKMMILLFGAMAVFFELVIFENFNPLLPIALIGFGIYLAVNKQPVIARS